MTLTEKTKEQMKNYLFGAHAPDFAFEKGEDEILEMAIEKGYVTIWFLPDDTITYSLTKKYIDMMQGAVA